MSDAPKYADQGSLLFRPLAADNRGYSDDVVGIGCMGMPKKRPTSMNASSVTNLPPQCIKKIIPLDLFTVVSAGCPQ
jgi:hypothetical protein